MSAEMKPTGTFVGRCVTCGRRYYAETAQARQWCDCRAAAGFPQTCVKYRPVRGVVSETKRCDTACLDAKSEYCRCECGGRNHGRGTALDMAGVA